MAVGGTYTHTQTFVYTQENGWVRSLDLFCSVLFCCVGLVVSPRFNFLGVRLTDTQSITSLIALGVPGVIVYFFDIMVGMYVSGAGRVTSWQQPLASPPLPLICVSVCLCLPVCVCVCVCVFLCVH